MSRKLIGCLCAVFLVASVSWAAADALLGTWTMDVAKTRKSMPEMPSNWPGGTITVESLGAGYKVTSTFGGAPVQVITVDFKQGETAVRDEKGKEIDRIKSVRRSPLEIETTSLKSGLVANYKILPSGEMQMSLIWPKDSPVGTQTMYFNRTR